MCGSSVGDLHAASSKFSVVNLAMNAPFIATPMPAGFGISGDGSHAASAISTVIDLSLDDRHVATPMPAGFGISGDGSHAASAISSVIDLSLDDRLVATPMPSVFNLTPDCSPKHASSETTHGSVMRHKLIDVLEYNFRCCTISWSCESYHVRYQVDTHTQLKLVDLPGLLVLDVIRYYADMSPATTQGTRVAVAATAVLRNDTIDFPIKLNMGLYTEDRRDAWYDLCAVIYFIGDTGDSGHYVVDARGLKNADGICGWDTFDDYVRVPRASPSVHVNGGFGHQHLARQFFYTRREEFAPPALPASAIAQNHIPINKRLFEHDDTEVHQELAFPLGRKRTRISPSPPPALFVAAKPKPIASNNVHTIAHLELCKAQAQRSTSAPTSVVSSPARFFCPGTGLYDY